MKKFCFEILNYIKIFFEGHTFIILFYNYSCVCTVVQNMHQKHSSCFRDKHIWKISTYMTVSPGTWWLPCFGAHRDMIWMATWNSCINDGFYTLHVSLAYMAMFHRQASNPGPLVRKWVLCRQGNRSSSTHAWEDAFFL